MTTHLFVASTAFGVATLTAALEGGAFPPADRGILVLSNNAAFPETAHDIVDIAGIGTLLDRFDSVYSYNDAIHPQHPSGWHPRGNDLPIWNRYFRSLWELGDDDIRLIVESIQADPALALAEIFTDAAVDVYADGLMSYGPTRNGLPTTLGVRIERVLHLDLVPGLVPVLLSEWDVEPVVISTEAFRNVIAAIKTGSTVAGTAGEPIGELPVGQSAREPGSVAVIVGQYLASAEILTPEEEENLHTDLIRGAVGAGFRELVFKPHPTAPGSAISPLVSAAESLGARLVVHSEPELLETWFEDPAIGLVLGCFSTALLTAAQCYGLPIASAGTELLLERLRPFENSNRIPVTLVDLLVPSVDKLAVTGDGAGATGEAEGGGVPTFGVSTEYVATQVVPLVQTLSYTMQADRYPWLREAAEKFLTEHYRENKKYFRRKRLTALDLPGRLPARSGTSFMLVVLPPGVRRRARQVLGPKVSPFVGRTARGLQSTTRTLQARTRILQTKISRTTRVRGREDDDLW